MPLYRFHENHGVNVRLSENGEVAKRITSFANAITFSEKTLQPGEIFMVEIDEQESGWSGHLRCGLTQHCPSKMMPLRHTEPTVLDEIFNVDGVEKQNIPQYSMPDLTSMGKSWIFAITKHHNKVPRTIQDDEEEQTETSSFIQNCGNSLQVGNKMFPQSLLVKDLFNIALNSPPQALGGAHNHGESMGSRSKAVANAAKFQATSIGSRIGITYEVQNVNSECKVFMHLIINGEDQGPSVMETADLHSPFYAIVDVYGTTKQVKIIQLNYVPTLQECCRMQIRTTIKEHEVQRLPLPAKLKSYLRFELL